jgi:hypothetical protein
MTGLIKRLAPNIERYYFVGLSTSEHYEHEIHLKDYEYTCWVDIMIFDDETITDIFEEK